ncbi:hypothetical protein LY78DRAFT_227269 [Colletotrichum sublineola]|nr:hypothetical protein LY78DRAFT_227269 [Colletotrichum sublineola]
MLPTVLPAASRSEVPAGCTLRGSAPAPWVHQGHTHSFARRGMVMYGVMGGTLTPIPPLLWLGNWSWRLLSAAEQKHLSGMWLHARHSKTAHQSASISVLWEPLATRRRWLACSTASRHCSSRLHERERRHPSLCKVELRSINIQSPAGGHAQNRLLHIWVDAILTSPILPMSPRCLCTNTYTTKLTTTSTNSPKRVPRGRVPMMFLFFALRKYTGMPSSADELTATQQDAANHLSLLHS